MSSLSDHVDRISHLAKSIRSTAAAAATPLDSTSALGPFTNAVLHAPLGDLIRDIDPAELGLFTLVPPAKPAAARPLHDTENVVHGRGEIARVEFHGATPLKKPPAPKLGRPDAQRTGEHEPEVYARAALKYLDRYQSIRPMPRASEQALRIIEQLETVRESIQSLNDQLKQHTNAGPSGPPLSPKSMVREEERRMQDAQAQIAALKKRKDALLKQKTSSKMSVRLPLKPRPKPKPQTPQPPPVSPPDTQEETFWNTPAAAARTLHFAGDSLLDEHVDLADVSTVSFASPVPMRSRGPDLNASRPASRAAPQHMAGDPAHAVESGDVPLDDGPVTDDEDGAPEMEDTEDIDGEDEERTVVLPKPPPLTQPSWLPEEPTTPAEARDEPASHMGPCPPVETPSNSNKRPKIKVTTELESIISKIWASIGELIMPGRRFDASGGNKHPRAKETIAHLWTLADRAPAPSSPSTASLSSFSLAAAAPPAAPSQPTAQQVLTAQMLLALLSAPPAYALPLIKLKEILAAKTTAAGIGSLGGASVTRPIYGCVAKRLLKIERGGREQVVMFDV
ncbi:hypothetical protein AcV7_004057 [Taiwanofungus camphoratus]|nr:hypothetical protein AcV7_004057 [Antrodia cinnamomea]